MISETSSARSDQVGALALLFLISVSGCGAPERCGNGNCGVGPDGGGGAATPYQQWCTEYIGTACDLAIRCGVYNSVTACRAAESIFLPCTVTAAMSDGRSVFDAAAGQACINEVNSLACDAHGSFACGMMIHGTVGLNGACYGDRECQSDLICDTTSTCPGLCRTPTPDGQTSNGVPCALSSSLYGTVCLGPTPIGQSCAPTGTVTRDRLCTLGAFCSAAKVCTAQPLANEGCTPGDYYECAGSLHCSGGVCAPLGAVSAPCDSTRFCKSDLYCSATNVCTPPGPVGTACSAVAWQCQPRLFCEMLAGSPTGTCQAPHTIGQSCTWRGYQCGELGGGSSLYCTATSSTPGVCALKKSADAACQGSSECQSQTCTNSVCVPYPGVCVDPTP